jgi:hypothetical protein
MSDDDFLYEDESVKRTPTGYGADVPKSVRPRQINRRPQPVVKDKEKQDILHGPRDVGFKWKSGVDPNVMSIWEVAAEIMYVNGWKSRNIKVSSKREDQLVELVMLKYQENGWMINPHRASVMGRKGLAEGNNLSDDIWIEMTADASMYVRQCIWTLFKGDPYSTDFDKRYNFDPEDPSTWPGGMNLTLDPSLRKYDTYHPSRWHAGSFTPPDIISDGLPWYQKALIPLVWFQAWFLSLTTKWQAVIGIVILLFIWWVVASIF